MRASRTQRQLAAAALAGLTVLSLTSCKPGTKAAGASTEASASASAAAGAGVSGVPSGVPSGLPTGLASPLTGAAASAAAGAVNGVKSAAGKAAGSKVVGDAPATCAVSDLKGTITVPSVASGINVGNLPAGVLASVVSLVNTTSHSCVLDGWAGLTPIAAGNPVSGVKQTNVGSPAPGAVTIAAGGTAYVGVAFTSGAGCPALQSVKLTFPGESGVLQVPVSTGTSAQQPLSVCPGVARTGPVTSDIIKSVSLLH